MRSRLLGLTIAAALLIPASGEAQDLIFDSFRDYLDSLRIQAGIPGLSVALVGGQRDPLGTRVRPTGRGTGDPDQNRHALSSRRHHPSGHRGACAALCRGRTTLARRHRRSVRPWQCRSRFDPPPASEPHERRRGRRGVLLQRSSLESLAEVVRECTQTRIHRAMGQLFDRLGATDTAPGPDPGERFGRARHDATALFSNASRHRTR